jgi:pimeloyl-ACP methyl ester carboxylesterase
VRRVPRIVYCHGFASSPRGHKAAALRETLAPEGFEIDAPDLNLPSFEKLDWDAMVARVVESASSRRTDAIVGSSLGALVALTASRRAPAPLVLVAPVLGFGPRWTPALPPGDPVPFVDRETGRARPIHRAFVDSMLRGPEDVGAPPCAVTVIAGRRDELVPFGQVRAAFDRWAASGRLAARSEFVELPGADHGMREFVGVIADAVRRRVQD